MRLFLDLGNSRLKWATGREPGDWLDHGVCELDGIEGSLDRQWGGMAAPATVWMSGVGATPAQVAIAGWIADHWSIPVRRLTASAACCGVSNGYHEPATLGSDRWAAMIGAWAMAAGPLCVVDCGTAVTVDALDANGRFVGGAIMPGLALARAALVSGTAGIDSKAANEALSALGCDTAAAVAAGTCYGIAGAIDRLLDEAAVVTGRHRVIVTGGDGGRIIRLLRRPASLVPDLVLRGLALVAEQT